MASPLTPSAIRQSVLDQLPDVQALYLFGSHAQGRARPDSDIDLAVMTATPLSCIRRFHVQSELAASLNRDVDLVDLRDASTVLRLEVIHHGQLLYSREKSDNLAFEARVLGDYAEWMDATRPLRDAAYQRGHIRA